MISYKEPLLYVLAAPTIRPAIFCIVFENLHLLTMVCFHIRLIDILVQWLVDSVIVIFT
jgi:hypothetical protein